ncbi:unnamed protein product [Prunus armeniaca]
MSDMDEAGWRWKLASEHLAWLPRRHMGVFIIAWLEQQVGCVVIEKGILHVSQALFRPRDEGLPPIRTDFLVDLLVAQGVSRSVTKW